MTLKKVKEITMSPMVVYLDIHTEQVIKDAMNIELKGCVIVGTFCSGVMYCSSSYADVDEAIRQLELAKLRLRGVKV